MFDQRIREVIIDTTSEAILRCVITDCVVRDGGFRVGTENAAASTGRTDGSIIRDDIIPNDQL